MQQYSFSQDWFAGHIPLFNQFLDHLKDRPCRLLEIGSFEGRSATWLIDNIATHPSADIVAIDMCENPQLRRNLAETGQAAKVTLHFGKSGEVLRTLPFDTYDFAYIDGCHWTVETLEDAVLTFPLMKAGGVIAFDDYRWDNPRYNEQGRPKEAIDAFLAIYADQIELLHRGYQVWVRKKLPHEVTHRKRPSLHFVESKWLRQPRKQIVKLWAHARKSNKVAPHEQQQP